MSYTRIKLHEAQEIYNMADKGMNGREIAKALGRSGGTISRILRFRKGKTSLTPTGAHVASIAAKVGPTPTDAANTLIGVIADQVLDRVMKRLAERLHG